MHRRPFDQTAVAKNLQIVSLVGRKYVQYVEYRECSKESSKNYDQHIFHKEEKMSINFHSYTKWIAKIYQKSEVSIAFWFNLIKTYYIFSSINSFIILRNNILMNVWFLYILYSRKICRQHKKLRDYFWVSEVKDKKGR